MTKRFALIPIIAAFGLTACGQSAEESSSKSEVEDAAAPVATNCPTADEAGIIEIAPGLTARIVEKGYGRRAVTGDYADTNVWLWLYDEAAADHHGAFIWESGDNVFQFTLGAGQVIKGWDLGVPCMLEGETRELVVAGDLAYGPSGRGEIPPNATLIFTIELQKLKASQ
jgi:FKBP-type peptidyl-prolyl cis-trans isomerase FkpA